jgi:hypothetical protein
MEEKLQPRNLPAMEEMAEMEEVEEISLSRRSAGPPPSRAIAGVRGHSPRAQANSLSPAERPLGAIVSSAQVRFEQ